MIKVSHSQLQTLDRCELKWDLSRGWQPKQVDASIQKGRLVHKGLAFYYRQIKEFGPREREPNHAVERLRDHMQKLQQSVETQADLEAFSAALNVCVRYVRDYAPFADADWEPLGVEQYHTIELETPNGYKYQLTFGYDLFVKEKSRQILVETKTVGNAKFWTQLEMDMDVQVPIYIGGLRELGIKVDEVVFNQLNTYQYKNYQTVSPEKLFQRGRTTKFPSEIDQTFVEVGYAVEHLIKMQEEGRPPRRSFRRDCSTCWFQPPCQLGMRGGPEAMQGFLEAFYDKKRWVP